MVKKTNDTFTNTSSYNYYDWSSHRGRQQLSTVPLKCKLPPSREKRDSSREKRDSPREMSFSLSEIK